MSTVIHWNKRLVIDKDPDAEKVYTVDGARLLATGVEFDDWEFIVASSLSPDATPLVIIDDTLVPSPSSSVANQGVKFRMTAGTPGATYTVTFRHTTDETPPQTDDHSFQVPILEQ